LCCVGLGKSQQKIIVEKVNIEAGGQAAIGVYEGVGQKIRSGGPYVMANVTATIAMFMASELKKSFLYVSWQQTWISR